MRLAGGRGICHSEGEGYGFKWVKVVLVSRFLSFNTPSENLATSNFNTPDDIATFSRKFDEGLKRVFTDEESVYYVKFGGARDNDPEHGITGGKLLLTG